MLSILLPLLAVIPGQADVPIPVIGRPANFSGAAGAYRIEVRASPTSVRVEDPVTLTIKIISRQPGKPGHPPRRELLKLFPADLENSFFVEPLPENDGYLDGENAWEFSWRLMPKHESCKEIPAPEFVYYHTAPVLDFKTADGATGITLEVKPRPGVLVSAPPGTRAKFQHIVEGEHLVADGPTTATRVLILVGGIAIPPLACLLGYWFWRSQFPEAAERMRRRRGKALKGALGKLRKLGSQPGPGQVRAIIVDYLRLHVHLPAGEPTPGEIKTALSKTGVNSEIAARIEAVVVNCDAARFAPATSWSAAILANRASDSLEELEAELCAPIPR
jgi:hypothetical protein